MRVTDVTVTLVTDVMDVTRVMRDVPARDESRKRQRQPQRRRRCTVKTAGLTGAHAACWTKRNGRTLNGGGSCQKGVPACHTSRSSSGDSGGERLTSRRSVLRVCLAESAVRRRGGWPVSAAFRPPRREQSQQPAVPGEATVHCGVRCLQQRSPPPPPPPPRQPQRHQRHRLPPALVEMTRCTNSTLLSLRSTTAFLLGRSAPPADPHLLQCHLSLTIRRNRSGHKRGSISNSGSD